MWSVLTCGFTCPSFSCLFEVMQACVQSSRVSTYCAHNGHKLLFDHVADREPSEEFIQDIQYTQDSSIPRKSFNQSYSAWEESEMACSGLHWHAVVKSHRSGESPAGRAAAASQACVTQPLSRTYWHSRAHRKFTTVQENSSIIPEKKNALPRNPGYAVQMPWEAAPAQPGPRTRSHWL